MLPRHYVKNQKYATLTASKTDQLPVGKLITHNVTHWDVCNVTILAEVNKARSDIIFIDWSEGQYGPGPKGSFVTMKGYKTTVVPKLYLSFPSIEKILSSSCCLYLLSARQQQKKWSFRSVWHTNKSWMSIHAKPKLHFGTTLVWKPCIVSKQPMGLARINIQIHREGKF